METTVLALMLCLVMTSFPTESVTIPLSMMDNSIDDMYNGCSDAMGEKVKNEYFPREMKKNELFKKAWENKEKTAIKRNTRLTKEQNQALLVYTGESPKVYEPFNAVVRDSADKYATNEFTYHALHYWLTTALQRLKSNTCRITYRRSKQEFTGEVNQEIRFGYFASSSPSPIKTHFGIKSCFQIETCLGVSIKDYSLYASEDEVLIPPYEKFRITKIAKDTYQRLKKCEKIFVLKSTGSQSNLNCKAT